MIAILTTVLVLALIGLVLWAVLRLIPMPEVWKTVLIAVAVILTLIWLINGLGGEPLIRFPR